MALREGKTRWRVKERGAVSLISSLAPQTHRVRRARTQNTGARRPAAPPQREEGRGGEGVLLLHQSSMGKRQEKNICVLLNPEVEPVRFYQGPSDEGKGFSRLLVCT